jgi:hypothetical protein
LRLVALVGRYRINPWHNLSVQDYAWMVRFTTSAVYEAVDYIRSRKSDDAEDFIEA